MRVAVLFVAIRTAFGGGISPIGSGADVVTAAFLNKPANNKSQVDETTATTTPFLCVPPTQATDTQLLALGASSCRKIGEAVTQFHPLMKWRFESSQDAMLEKVKRANAKCDSADKNSPLAYAKAGLEAWGTIMMQGDECCDSLRAPYCYQTSKRTSHFAPVIAGVLIMFLVWLSPRVCKSSVVSPPLHFTSRARPLTEDIADAASGAGAALPALQQRDIAQDLHRLWDQHSLHVLPQQQEFGECSVKLFDELRRTFGFQDDSVQNQFEHFLSLWRSQVSAVGDFFYEQKTFENRKSSDQGALDQMHKELLKDGMTDLHDDLLAGFLRWRSVFQDAGMPKGPAKLAGVASIVPQTGAEAVKFKDLPEVATYLLVWGEAGNLRFMPELICFITELALAAAPGDLYAQCPPTSRSLPYLTHIVRPIYRVIFNENYKRVTINAANNKDKQELLESHSKYMPPDSINYDDWNELFSNPKLLEKNLVLNDGGKFWDIPHEDRFKALPRVDWATSLSNAKMHREMHSLWGVFAATHRVWFLHAILFGFGMWTVVWKLSTKPVSLLVRGDASSVPLCGDSAEVALASVGMVVPIHAFFWKASKFFVHGQAVRQQKCNFSFENGGIFVSLGNFLARFLGWGVPVMTYAAVRYCEVHNVSDVYDAVSYACYAHYFVCIIGSIVLLFLPANKEDLHFTFTKAKPRMMAIRALFWVCVLGLKFGVGLVTMSALDTAFTELHIVRPGRMVLSDFEKFAFTPQWDKEMIQWFALFGTGFWLFCADTQFWVVLGCTFLGTLTAFKQRGWKVYSFSTEDAVAFIPKRFSEKVLTYCNMQGVMDNLTGSAKSFPIVWDRIVDFMHYEDKLDDSLYGQLSFQSSRGAGARCNDPYVSRERIFKLGGEPTEGARSSIPKMFQQPMSLGDRCLKRDIRALPDNDFPTNPEAQWRIMTLSRALTLEMPRPYRVPFVPGLTVLIPHYADMIGMLKKDLYNPGADTQEIVPLISWLKARFEDDFKCLGARMQRQDVAAGGGGWRTAGDDWGAYQDGDWMEICDWASMRNQTLWRTVSGMTLYHQVLDCHWEVQRETLSKLARKDVWDASELFSCIVSMQLYPFFDADQYNFTNKMLEKFPKSFKIVFIDIEAKGGDSGHDGIHERQERRYYSCLIDKTCPQIQGGLKDLQRQPRLRVELPGFPILGDGKGDNQNHAIPFTRGSIIQCIDANQGAYFEQMLLLPCALGEFRNEASVADGVRRRDRPPGLARKIVGFPEHITSDIGTIGDFAAGAEMAFGTMLQRAYAVLGSRMHYGHPDMMNKTFVMQQGGVSKATKTVNLSEDIFAGLDFTLRGEGRSIKHCEYFHLAKGRDLGFNTVLTFFAKLSAGTGEQLLTRQMLRLGQCMGLGEFLGCYYAHGGYYITQHLLSRSVPMLTFIWLLIVLDHPANDLSLINPTDCATDNCIGGDNGAVIMAQMLARTFSWLILLFMMATLAPLFIEVWIENGFFSGFARLFKQMITGAPFHFIFQAKIIGVYTTNEIRHGGAAYLPTGRGLPTDRRPFFKKEGGLYLDWAQQAFYDGFRLLAALAMVTAAGGLSSLSPELVASLFWWCFSLIMTATSWLYAPFIFNPYQFAHRFFWSDWADWKEFFLADAGKHWKAWHDKTQLKPGSGLRCTLVDVLWWMLFVGCWYTVLNSKMYTLTLVTNVNIATAQLWSLTPPIGASLLFCFAGVPLLKLCGIEVRLAGCAMIVSVLDGLEAVSSLWGIILLGRPYFATGLIFKYSMLSFMLFLTECVFSFKSRPGALETVLVPLKVWLHTHRMAFDLIVSLFLFGSLAPCVLFDVARSWCCPGCSLHQLFLFRDPGHSSRVEATVNMPMPTATGTGSFFGMSGRGLSGSGMGGAPPQWRGPPQQSVSLTPMPGLETAPSTSPAGAMSMSPAHSTSPPTHTTAPPPPPPSVGAHSTAPPTHTAVAPAARAKCKFADKCTRKNPDHFKEESHPGDADWSVPAGPHSATLPTHTVAPARPPPSGGT